MAKSWRWSWALRALTALQLVGWGHGGLLHDYDITKAGDICRFKLAFGRPFGLVQRKDHHACT